MATLRLIAPQGSCFIVLDEPSLDVVVLQKNGTDLRTTRIHSFKTLTEAKEFMNAVYQEKLEKDYIDVGNYGTKRKAEFAQHQTKKISPYKLDSKMFGTSIPVFVAVTKEDYPEVQEKDQDILESFLNFRNIIFELYAEKDGEKQRLLRQKSEDILFSNDDKLIKFRQAYTDIYLPVANSPVYENATKPIPTILQISVANYFKTFYSGREKFSIEFYPKLEGSRPGEKAQVILEGQKSTTYFIKTHHNGGFPLNDPCGKLDLKELFVYKVLANTELGEQVHFIPEIYGKNVYIATKDAGCSKKTDGKCFVTFETFKSSLNTEESNALKEDEDFIEQTTTIDIFTRIFLLADVCDNETNFGCVISKDKRKLKIIDFMITYSFKGYRDEEILRNFIKGSTYSTHTALEWVWKECGVESRLQTAKKIMNNLKLNKNKNMGLITAIDTAHKFVLSQINQEFNYLSTGMKTSLEDLRTYVDAVKQNFREFEKQLTDKMSSIYCE